MANPIAESLLAVLSALGTGYVDTRAARGQENRSTQLALTGQAQRAEETAAERAQRAKEAAATETYRGKVLEGQQVEAGAAAQYRQKSLENQAAQITGKAELDRAQQDYQNRTARLELQMQGLQNVINDLRAKGTGGGAEDTPTALYQKALSEGIGRILTNENMAGTLTIPDPNNPKKKIKVDRTQYAIQELDKQLKGVYGIGATSEGGTGNNAEIDALINSLSGEAGTSPGLITPIAAGGYPSSPIGGFSTSPNQSDFELNQRLSTLRVLR